MWSGEHELGQERTALQTKGQIFGGEEQQEHWPTQSGTKIPTPEAILTKSQLQRHYGCRGRTWRE